MGIPICEDSCMSHGFHGKLCVFHCGLCARIRRGLMGACRVETFRPHTPLSGSSLGPLWGYLTHTPLSGSSLSPLACPSLSPLGCPSLSPLLIKRALRGNGRIFSWKLGDCVRYLVSSNGEGCGFEKRAKFLHIILVTMYRAYRKF